MPGTEANELSGKIIGAAIEVHRRLGRGLLESAYEKCLCIELEKRGLQFQSQIVLPIVYDEVIVDSAYRLDLLVEDQIIVEIKAVEKTLDIHKVQLLTYLRFAGKNLGLLINFHAPRLIDGLTRVANDLPE